jgi:hypothetical protein
MEDLIDFQSVLYQVEKYKYIERNSFGAFTVLFTWYYQFVKANFWYSLTNNVQLAISSNNTEKKEYF